ncbi:MAG: cupin domain-containing protein [Actinomycetota bacterium]|nr:cupin domain-containing protein [Actinomycetota bacterium]
MTLMTDSVGRTLTGRPALRRCISVDPETFARQYWGTQLLLSRRAELPARFEDLLDLDGVDELLSRRGLRTPFLRIVRDGKVVSSSQFTGPGGVGAGIADQIRDDRVLTLFDEGATIALQALHRTWPPVIDFSIQLGADLGHPVQVNAYATPPSSRGFAAHYDVHDVFVLQLAGRKHWTVHAPVHPDPLRNQPWDRCADAVRAAAQDEPPILDTVLEPGDALYLPRGYLHAANTLGGISAHLTVGIHAVTRYALVETLSALVADDPDLRQSLPLGLDLADPEALAPHLRATLDALTSALHRMPAERVAQRVRERVWLGNRPEPVSPLAHSAFTDELGAGDVVRLRAGLRYRLRENANYVVLELPDRTMTLPAVTVGALRTLLDGQAVTVGELPGLDSADQLVLVRRLLREGVLVPGGG